jgi:hypothetical protein
MKHRNECTTKSFLCNREIAVETAKEDDLREGWLTSIEMKMKKERV